MPRQPTKSEQERIDEAVEQHLREVGCPLLPGDRAVTLGPSLQECVAGTLPIESDSQQRKVAKIVASQPFVLDIDSHRVTLASSAGNFLLTDYEAHIKTVRAIAGASPPREGSAPRGRPIGGTTLPFDDE